MSKTALPYIPETITVHLGRPDDPTARNVTVPFPDYIKNVASSEIYPTWPEAAIRANMYAQISFALNRIYTEWYRSQGYDFDITNSTAFDQAYVEGRDIFDNIAEIADELFNDYLVRPGSVEPLFAQYCDGDRVQCDGLSQWGTVPLAEAGLSPYEILTEFYGPDLAIVRDAPTAPNLGSYPGSPLRLGDVSNDVRTIQLRLNRISNNYPAIPKIYPVDGVFDQGTLDAVKKFQQVFGLTPDGIVGQSTWYRIAYLYTAITKLAELNSEGVRLEDVTGIFPDYLRRGDKGDYVRVLQYYLNAISVFFTGENQIPIDGDFGTLTEQAVRSVQRDYGLPVDGIVGPQTWAKITEIYNDIGTALPEWEAAEGAPLFPGRLVEGMQGNDVRQVQEWLNILSTDFPDIPKLTADGIFGPRTTQALTTAQSILGLTPTGFVGPITWDTLARQAARIESQTQEVTP